MKAKAILIAAVLGATALGPAAHAGTFNFTYSEAELDSDKGRHKVLNRLVKEARGYCRAAYRTSGTALRMQQQCRHDVMDGMVADIGDQRFAALYHEEIVLAARQ